MLPVLFVNAVVELAVTVPGDELVIVKVSPLIDVVIPVPPAIFKSSPLLIIPALDPSSTTVNETVPGLLVLLIVKVSPLIDVLIPEPPTTVNVSVVELVVVEPDSALKVVHLLSEPTATV